jgi:hypothetical protein
VLDFYDFGNTTVFMPEQSLYFSPPIFNDKDVGSCVKGVQEDGKLWGWNSQSQTFLTMKVALNGC